MKTGKHQEIKQRHANVALHLKPFSEPKAKWGLDFGQSQREVIQG